MENLIIIVGILIVFGMVLSDTIHFRLLKKSLLELKVTEYKELHFSEIFSKSGLSIIEIFFENIPYNFLVDSGANMNSISKTSYEKLLHKYCEDTGKKGGVTSVLKDLDINSIVTTTFQCYDNNYRDVEFQVFDMSSADFKRLYGIEVHGILGGVFCAEYGWNIDFDKKVIKIPK